MQLRNSSPSAHPHSFISPPKKKFTKSIVNKKVPTVKKSKLVSAQDTLSKKFLVITLVRHKKSRTTAGWEDKSTKKPPTDSEKKTSLQEMIR
ncbi:hypothetical protein L1887_18340 [Cichorium endivia]|nr:hypothetical protein L1887_18340 [Cichorium endivia]